MLDPDVVAVVGGEMVLLKQQPSFWLRRKGTLCRTAQSWALCDRPAAGPQRWLRQTGRQAAPVLAVHVVVEHLIGV
jgi:hypothetical protein